MKTLLERFEEKDIPEPNTGCWLWMGALRTDCGLIWVDGKIVTASRASWSLFKGPIEDGLFVLHRCDNPPCVNPEHLFLGTKSDNSRDAFDKGRLTQIGLGEHSMAAKLNNESVLFVKASQESNSNLARRLGVDRGTIRAIRVGKSWKHLLDLTN